MFAAADVFVAPFGEDNLPNVILEALACGTPVAAFAAGGIPDAVEHEHNGFLAPAGDAAALGRGIIWVLADLARHKHLRSGTGDRRNTLRPRACASDTRTFGELAASA